jgi:hypothetical protein
MKKVYRGLEYHKLRIALLIGAIAIICLVSCKPTNHTDVQMRTFTTDTLKTDSINEQ